jgi:hypothetical protein
MNGKWRNGLNKSSPSPSFFISFNFLSPSANSRFLTEKIRDQKREGINITRIQLRHDSPLTVFPLSKKAR